uniref:Uncharacterized protein n=1 Tax=Colobus angolensis palliatus TaxID=336983 RepID=A0A2K5I313_COLAP
MLQRGLARWKPSHIKENLEDEAQLPLIVLLPDTLSDLRTQLVARAGAPGSAPSTTTRRLNDHPTVRLRLDP